MQLPIEIFLSFIAFAVIMGIVGLWKRIPLMMFIAGGLITFWAITTDNIIMNDNISSIDSDLPKYSYVVQVGTTVSSFIDGTSIGKGERLLSNSTLIGQKAQCIDVELSKAGTPTGFLEVGIFYNLDSNALLYKFGQIDVSTLTTSNVFHTFCVDEGFEHIMKTNDVIGAKFNGGTALNHPDIRRTAVEVFDGTATQAVSVISNTSPWTTIALSDFNMRIYDIETIDTNLFPFTEYPKILFGIMASIFMLAGALIWKYEET